MSYDEIVGKFKSGLIDCYNKNADKDKRLKKKDKNKLIVVTDTCDNINFLRIEMRLRKTPRNIYVGAYDKKDGTMHLSTFELVDYYKVAEGSVSNV